MIIRELLNFNREYVLIILSYILDKSKSYILINQDMEISNEIECKTKEILEKTKKGLPLQYAIGIWNFYGLDLKVDKRALIPRPETEILVEKILNSNWKKDRILDIGCGSGAISIALCDNLKNSKIIGCDISDDAISLSNENKQKFGFKNVDFIKSDLFSNITGKFDIIVSNPPYIDNEDMKKLDNKLSYEPQNALYGGEDGLYFYRKIIDKSMYYLNERGIIIFEIGYNQRDDITKILEDKNYKNINCIKDYNDFDRIIYANL